MLARRRQRGLRVLEMLATATALVLCPTASAVGASASTSAAQALVQAPVQVPAQGQVRSFDDPRSLLDPSALAPTRDAATCRDALMDYLAALDNVTEWATQMSDASGRRRSALTFGNHMWLGSQTQCQQLGPRAQFFVATLQLSSPAAANASAANASAAPARGPQPPPSLPVLLGVCAPSACNAAFLATALALPPPARLLALKAAPDPKFSLADFPAFYVLLVLSGAAALLVLAGTVLDVALRRRARLRDVRYAAQGSASTLSESGGGAGAVQPSPAPSCAASDAGTDPAHSDALLGLGTRLLLCFSLLANLRKICDTRTEDSLACLHGLRVFSLVWVIAGHACMFAFPFSDNKGFRLVVERDFLFQSIGNGAFSVDTFFFISGLLVSHVFFKVSSKNETMGKNKNKGNLADSAVQFVGVFTYRVLRLIPPYLLVMLMAYLTNLWFTHNSIFPNPVADIVNCPRYWWRNLLFINTLFPVDNMCMIWSWYLANDTQFYTLAIILLLLSVRYPKTAASTLVVLVISSLITTAAIVVNTDHTPRVEEPLGLFDALYDKPWMRLGPYAVGMAIGLLLHRTGLKMHMHKAVVVSGWALAMTLSFSLVHGLYGELGPIASAAYVALSHIAWSLSVAWITVACCTGYGGPVNKILSHPSLYPLSRITYCAYLTHPIIMFMVIMYMDAPIHLSRGTMSVMIFGYVVASYLLSLVVSLGFEAPTIAILNLLHPIRRKFK